MKKKKFKKAFGCRLFKSYGKNLAIVKLRNGTYAVLKYIRGNWKLGTLKFRNKKTDDILEVNVFNDEPILENHTLRIGERLLSLRNLSFKDIVIYTDAILRGHIRKDYIKKMPAF
ncbi:MAG: hypothetical protein MRY57_03160 [Candidatus Pacebacteria bacterium]|nr:hypothetical protein [Candidatus Paceibacterota bacterium]